MNNDTASSTKKDIVGDLRKISLQQGDVVIFHSSLSSLGHVIGGANTVIEAFLEAVGPKGTVAVPTIIHTSGLPRAPFDIHQSASEVGAITEALRKRPDALRSFHPTHSVAAVGARAQELIEGHQNATSSWTPWGSQAFGKGSPWDLLYQWNARYLFLGVTFQVCTLFHYAQTRYLEKHQRDYAEPIPFPYFSHDKMGELLKKQFHLQPGNIGEAQSWLLNARDIVDQTLTILEDDPFLLAEENQQFPFMTWAKQNCKQSHTLRGGMASTPIVIDGKRYTDEGTNLKARVLIIENDEGKFVLISLTLIGLNAQSNAYLRELASRQTGIPVDRIMITCTHVHGKPATLTSAENHIKAMVETISESIIEALKNAQANMAPIRLAIASRNVGELTRIRRARMNDGKVYTIRRSVPSTWHSEQKLEYINVDGELDTELIVIRIDDQLGKPLGCLFHFTTHPLPDLHGFAADWIENIFGNGFVCLPLNGAFGDVDTIFDKPFNGKFAQDQLQFTGRVLSGAILELLGRAETKDSAAIKVLSAPLCLPVDSLVIEKRQNDSLSWIRAAACNKYFSTEMTTVQLGPLALVGIPGELACSFGLSIKRNSPFLHTCPIGLTNDEVGYLMSKASRELGGYEADPSYWALAASGSAEKVYQTAIDLLYKLEMQMDLHRLDTNTITDQLGVVT